MKKNTFLVCGLMFLLPLFSLVAQVSKPGAAPAIKETLKKSDKSEEFNVGSFAQSLSDKISSSGIAEGLKLFDDVPEEFIEDDQIMFLKSSVLLSAGKAKEAKPIAEKLLSKNKKSVDYLFLNAMICKSLGEKNKKSQYLKDILVIEPNNAEVNAELGNENMSAKAYEIAQKYYMKSIQSDPTYINGLFGYGQVCYYLGDFKEAKVAFNRILQLNPQEDIAWSYLAKLDAEDGNYGAAIKNVLKAIECNPGYYNYWIDYGDYLRFSAKNEEAIEAFSTAIELDPSYFLAYVYRAGLYETLGEYEKALADYKSIVRTNPQYHYAYESIGILAWHAGDWEECRKAYEKAYELTPENISYPLMVSACYQKEKNKLANKNFLTKVMKKLDRNSVEYSIVRLYYDKMGDSEVMRKIRQLDSKNMKGKLLYYMGVFYEINGGQEIAQELYLEIKQMNAPMFFEYRLAEWALESYEVAKL